MVPTNQERFDFSICEKERIAFSGSIQPHGYLAVLDLKRETLTHLSLNAPAFLTSGKEFSVAKVGTLPVADVLTPSELRSVRDAKEGQSEILRDARKTSTATYNCEYRRQGDLVIVEWEPAETLPRELFNTPHFSGPAQSMFDALVKWASSTAGFDRALIYKFEDDDTGLVLAEASKPGKRVYMGLRFPATDIPKVARAIYAVTKSRHIGDSSAEPVAIVATGGTNEAGDQSLDLTHVQLRSVSPFHMSYLRNMEVGTSVSVSIMYDGRLWGLLTCHRDQAKPVSAVTRRILEQAVHDAFTEYHRSQIDERMAFIERKSREITFVRHLIEGLAHPSRSDRCDDILSLTDSCGMAWFGSDGWHTHGITPQDDALNDIKANLSTRSKTGNFVSDCMKVAVPALNDAPNFAGLGAAWNLVKGNEKIALFFKLEAKREVIWGSSTSLAEAKPLTPHASFGQWKDIMSDHSLPWSNRSEHFVAGLKTSFLIS